MLYEYQCPKCDKKFEVVKHHSLYKEKEKCRECDIYANKLISLCNLNKVEQAEYNPALGCVVKNRRHRAEICKRKGLIEIGNEKPETIHKEMDKQLKRNLSWDGVI